MLFSNIQVLSMKRTNRKLEGIYADYVFPAAQWVVCPHI